MDVRCKIRSVLVCAICFLVATEQNLFAQISPGDLAKPHAHLEGMSNCTKCHVLGDKVSNEKCLDCHKELKVRVDQKKGYHASAEVTGKDCFTCHSDHHGRNFEIVRFDAQKFNHNLTGYNLTGAHAKQDCAACHKPERIESTDLRKKEMTYLGLKTECLACHRDAHQGTLSTDCKSCHDTESFKPASLFDHAKTDFPLRGSHKDADCKRCHEITFQNSALFQRFAGVPFNNCAVCHTDPHGGRFGTECKDCHNEQSFTSFSVNTTFNHNTTQFPLLGKHRKLDCTACHKTDPGISADQVFRDYKNKDFNNCVTCHEDVHESKFGVDCKSCHTEDSFQTRLNPDKFNHDLTGYALQGKHNKVDCRSCHETKMTEPLPHTNCADCHEDFHKGDFLVDNTKPDCRECHTVNGFEGSSYTIEQHNKSDFPLSGAHLATPCFACHLKEDTWTFRNLGKECSTCHQDIHEGSLEEKYYPQKTCGQCHKTESWASISFDHEKTGFALEGKHESNQCVSCHKSETQAGAPKTVPFKGLKTDCFACHDNVHRDQFEIEGVTDCRRCHDPQGWTPSTFDHNTARFKLEGAHQKVECKACHKPEIVEGKPVVQYRFDDFACAVCHQD